MPIQPEYGPDFGNLLLKGMQTYRGVKQIQREGAQDAQTAEIKDLSIRAQNDPEAMRMLAALDPDRANKIRLRADYEKDRFEKERAILASEIENLPLDAQRKALENRIFTVKERGGDPSNTMGLYNLLSSGDPAQMKEGQNAITNARIQGEKQGILKPAQIEGGVKPSVKAQHVIDKYGVEYGSSEFKTNYATEYPLEKGEGLSDADKKKAAVDIKIRRNTLIKGYQDIGFDNKQISKLLKITKDHGAEVGTLATEIELLQKTDPELADEKKFEMEQKLRKEYSKETGDFQKVQESYRRIKAIDPTAAGDIALVFNYMKMLDPGSTVREGEYATAKNAAGVPDIIMNQYNKLKDGKFLNPKQRADFRKQSGNLFGASKRKEKDVRSKLQKIAGQYNLTPDNIFFAEPEQGVVKQNAVETRPGAVDPLTTDELRQFE